jgi:hypothetical protein
MEKKREISSTRKLRAGGRVLLLPYRLDDDGLTWTPVSHQIRSPVVDCFFVFQLRKFGSKAHSAASASIVPGRKESEAKRLVA